MKTCFTFINATILTRAFVIFNFSKQELIHVLNFVSIKYHIGEITNYIILRMFLFVFFPFFPHLFFFYNCRPIFAHPVNNYSENNSIFNGCKLYADFRHSRVSQVQDILSCFHSLLLSWSLMGYFYCFYFFMFWWPRLLLETALRAFV